ncbi:MAG: hypothetical protein WD225_01555 [Ilumatobacteraceae bacterium]
MATSQRVVRAQTVPAGFLPHFQLFAMVSADRGEPAFGFERGAVGDHLGTLLGACRAAGAGRLRVGVSDYTDGALRPVVDAIGEVAASFDDVEVVADPDRSSSEAYYDGRCLELWADRDGRWIDVAEAGRVNVTARSAWPR